MRLNLFNTILIGTLLFGLWGMFFYKFDVEPLEEDHSSHTLTTASFIFVLNGNIVDLSTDTGEGFNCINTDDPSAIQQDQNIVYFYNNTFDWNDVFSALGVETSELMYSFDGLNFISNAGNEMIKNGQRLLFIEGLLDPDQDIEELYLLVPRENALEEIRDRLNECVN